MRRLDPWGPLFAVAATVVFLLHGFGGTLTRDLALYAYSGQQFAEGEPPYVSVLNRAGPLAHIVPGIGAAIARVVGTDDLHHPACADDGALRRGGLADVRRGA